jgi:uncharacterized protein with HEPN domain
MTRREETVALRHMRDHAAEAVAIAQRRSRSDLQTDRLFALGLTKLVEIIGEGAGRVSLGTRDAHPHIPWKQIVGTRNRLVHGYDEIDFDVLWKIVSVELPRLVQELEAILADQLKGES